AGHSRGELQRLNQITYPSSAHHGARNELIALTSTSPLICSQTRVNNAPFAIAIERARAGKRQRRSRTRQPMILFRLSFYPAGEEWQCRRAASKEHGS